MTDLPAAVLWDMDGTLVDSEPFWIQAEIELVRSFGRTWTVEDGMSLIGKDMSASAAALRARGVDLPTEEIGRRLSTVVARQVVDRPVWRPGARELLDDLAGRGVPQALVTSSPRVVADAVTDLLAGAPFAASVALEDVTTPKPAPEPYETAARLLGVPIRDCVALEDSLSGLRAAVASGAVTIAIPHVVALPADAGATIWPTLEGRGARDLAAVAAVVRRRGAAPAGPGRSAR